MSLPTILFGFGKPFPVALPSDGRLEKTAPCTRGLSEHQINGGIFATPSGPKHTVDEAQRKARALLP